MGGDSVHHHSLAAMTIGGEAVVSALLNVQPAREEHNSFKRM
jgi:hypothetical protein